jgi:hypothetical protein
MDWAVFSDTDLCFVLRAVRLKKEVSVIRSKNIYVCIFLVEKTHNERKPGTVLKSRLWPVRMWRTIFIFLTHLTWLLAIFGFSQRWKTLSVVAHSPVVPLLHQRFSSGQNRLLQKRSQRPWNHGIDVVKNVYGCREITLKSDRSFKFFVWLLCEKKIETLELERTSYYYNWLFALSMLRLMSLLGSELLMCCQIF